MLGENSRAREKYRKSLTKPLTKKILELHNYINLTYLNILGAGKVKSARTLLSLGGERQISLNQFNFGTWICAYGLNLDFGMVVQLWGQQILPQTRHAKVLFPIRHGSCKDQISIPR